MQVIELTNGSTSPKYICQTIELLYQFSNEAFPRNSPNWKSNEGIWDIMYDGLDLFINWYNTWWSV